MKTVAGLVVLLCVGMDVGIDTNSDFSAGPCSLQMSTNSVASETFDNTACPFGDSTENSYQVHPGVRCLGHDIKPNVKADIKGCEEACDWLPDCVGFVHSDDESRGFCRFKKDTCLKKLRSKPGLSLFVKPNLVKEVPYKVHPGVRCLGHDLKPDVKADIDGCKEACDWLLDCVGFVHSDDESRGFCRFKKDTCLKCLKPKPGLSLFVKPGIEMP